METLQYILENISKTSRVYKRPPKGKKSLIGLPYPFTSPCIDGIFREMYYWDTYFTNKGLLLTDMGEQAVNNVKNFIFLLYNYGKIPNGNRVDYLSRSQPPFFGLMLDDIMKCKPNVITVEEAFCALEKEYTFWQTKRIAPNSLNRYGCDLSENELKRRIHVASYRKRTCKDVAYTTENAENILCECESGWDFSPRFLLKCSECNPVDLNCLLYKDEILLAEWAAQCGYCEKAEFYTNTAVARKDRLIGLMKKDGIYYDYNYKSNEVTGVLSCAALFPFLVGIDNDKNDFLTALNRLERKFGIVACDYGATYYQWSAPNCWAPLAYIAFAAAEKLLLKDEALRIACKFVKATDSLFIKTGKLWEKYNAENGELDLISEYGTPEMLGWTAGVYVVFKNFIEKNVNL